MKASYNVQNKIRQSFFEISKIQNEFQDIQSTIHDSS